MILRINLILTINHDFFNSNSVTAEPVPRHRYQVNAAKLSPSDEARRGRIVGGSEATIEQFPYVVALFNGNFQSCGGKSL